MSKWINLTEDAPKDILDWAKANVEKGMTLTFDEKRGKVTVKVTYKVMRITGDNFWGKEVTLHKPDSKEAKAKGIVVNK